MEKGVVAVVEVGVAGDGEVVGSEKEEVSYGKGATATIHRATRYKANGFEIKSFEEGENSRVVGCTGTGLEYGGWNEFYYFQRGGSPLLCRHETKERELEKRRGAENFTANPVHHNLYLALRLLPTQRLSGKRYCSQGGNRYFATDLL